MKLSQLFIVGLLVGFIVFPMYNVSALVLRTGMRGDTNVMKLQQDLHRLGYYTGTIDGNFGLNTKKAVSTFQKNHKIKVDGIAGPHTLSIVASWIESGKARNLNESNWDLWCDEGKPLVRVISPNGGQKYEPGEIITVKWKTCNAPSNILGTIMFTYRDPIHPGASATAMKTASGKDETKNDGIEKMVLPNESDIEFYEMLKGPYYGIQVNFGIPSIKPEDPAFDHTQIMFADASEGSYSIE